VEFALIVPVFAMLVFGGLTGAIIYNHKLDLTHAAREGARYGATVPQVQCTPATNCGGKTWAQLVQSVTVARSNGDLNTSQVCAALVSGSTGAVVGGALQSTFTTQADGSSSCYSDGNADTGVRVQVSVHRAGDSIQGVVFTIPVTLTSQATAHSEQ
jgi:Flp pilus assembly protein TadG